MLIELPALVRQTHLLIFLHGLGDTGHGWSQMFRQLQRDRLPSVRMLFPTAPVQPVTVNGGHPMNSWYDIKNMDIGGSIIASDNNQQQQDQRTLPSDLDKSRLIVEQLIATELDSGRISSSRQVVLGGFSQGGAVTVHTLLQGRYALGGCVVLSSYLASAVAAQQCNVDNLQVPVFWGHGIADSVVRFKYGEASVSRLQQVYNMRNISFRKYAGMDHSSCDEEVDDLLMFLQEKVIDAAATV